MTISLSHLYCFRSVHNVRIERLWVDVTVQVGSYWHEQFTLLELHHGLNANSDAHIWLLHFLFLGAINAQLAAFAEAWNHHVIQIRNGPNRSPVDMFGFDMYTNGLRGTELPMSAEELELHGVDWEGLQEDQVMESRRANNTADEGTASWVGQAGPPAHLNEVTVADVVPPAAAADVNAAQVFEQEISEWLAAHGDVSVAEIWLHGMATARRYFGNMF